MGSSPVDLKEWPSYPQRSGEASPFERGQAMRLRSCLGALVVLALVVVVAPEASGEGGNADHDLRADGDHERRAHPGSRLCRVGGGCRRFGDHDRPERFVLRGDRTASRYGIDDTGGFDGVTIKNGTLRNFQNGVAALPGADKVSVSAVVASGNDEGITIFGEAAKIQSSTASGNKGDGIFAAGDSASIKSVTAYGNGFFGISVQASSPRSSPRTAPGTSASASGSTGDSASIKSSTASGNGSTGIRSSVMPPRSRATPQRQRFPERRLDLFGFGILVTSNYPAPPVGTEHRPRQRRPREVLPRLPVLNTCGLPFTTD